MLVLWSEPQDQTTRSSPREAYMHCQYLEERDLWSDDTSVILSYPEIGSWPSVAPISRCDQSARPSQMLVP